MQSSSPRVDSLSVSDTCDDSNTHTATTHGYHRIKGWLLRIECTARCKGRRRARSTLRDGGGWHWVLGGFNVTGELQIVSTNCLVYWPLCREETYVVIFYFDFTDNPFSASLLQSSSSTETELQLSKVDVPPRVELRLWQKRQTLSLVLHWHLQYNRNNYPLAARLTAIVI